MVLQHCEAGCRRELLFFQREEVRTHVTNLRQHLVSQSIYLLHLLSLLISYFSYFITRLLLQCLSELGIILPSFIPLAHVTVVVLQLRFKL